VSALYQAFVEIVPDASNLRRTLAKEFDAAGPEAGRNAGKGINGGVLGAVGKLAAPLAAAFATLGIGKIIRDSIGNASDLAEAGTAITAVFGSADATIQKFAAASAGNLGQSTNQTLDAARVFGVFGKAAGLGGEDLAGFSTDFITLAGDLASFNNTTPEAAIAALGAGLRGESEPLRQFGVLLDDATLKARATEMGIFSGTGALTQQQKVLAAQAEILAQTGTQQGDFAKTSGGLANQQRILAANLTNLSTTFGAVFLPIVTNIVTFLNTSVLPAFAGLAAMLAGGELSDLNFGQLIADQFTKVGSFITGGGIESIFASLSDTRAGFMGAMLEALPGIIDAVVQVIPLVLTALMTFVSQGILLMVGAAPDLLAGAVTLFTGLVNAIPVILPPLISAIVTLLPVLIGAVVGMIPQILGAAVTLFTALVNAIPVILPVLITAIITLLPMLIRAVLGLIPQLLGAAINLFTSLVNAIPQIIPKLIPAILGLLPVLVRTILGLIPDLIKAGGDLIGGLVIGLVRAGGSVGKALLDIASGAVKGFLKFLGIKSPSKLFAGFGSDIGEGLIVGVNSMRGAVAGSLTSMVNIPSVSTSFDASATALAGVAGAGSSGGFNNFGTIQVTDERALVDEITKRQRRALASSGIRGVAVA